MARQVFVRRPSFRQRLTARYGGSCGPGCWLERDPRTGEEYCYCSSTGSDVAMRGALGMAGDVKTVLIGAAALLAVGLGVYAIAR